jgi:acyl-CoA thioesterase I
MRVPLINSRCWFAQSPRWIAIVVLLNVTFAMSCGDDRSPTAPPEPPPPTKPAPSPNTATAVAARPRIVCLGDSLTAGPGLPPGADYPSLLQKRIDESGYVYEVVNAGVSGDTSAGGLRRADRVLAGGASIVILELGANDGLRGHSISEMEQNLSMLISKSRASGAVTILAGMEAPPNYGPEYTAAYRGVFRRLAEREKVVLIPFFLEGVAGRPELNLEDGIHPNPDGAKLVAENVWTYISPMLEK